ncbi:MAG: PAS domain S-box protein [Methylococcales bacterium]|nr:PAS domain S-box protein [Methylococcales bacterium]
MKANYNIMVWLAGATLMVVLGVMVAFWAFKQVQDSGNSREHTYAVLDGGNALLSALKDAETGQRGYLLTDDESWLQPYWAVHNHISDQLTTLRQQTSDAKARSHLDVLAPLVTAKLAYLANNIKFQRDHNLAALQANMRGELGKPLMNLIRVEMAAFIQLEKNRLAEREALFNKNMRNLLTVIVVTSLLTLLFALIFAYLFYKETQRRLKNRILVETQHLLEIQEDTNQKLQQTNVILQVSEERLSVTLNSIGDAVIATDIEGLVTLMNPVAEQLTGWAQTDAVGHSIDGIFRIINQTTRQPVINPINDALKYGTTQALDNHTVLIARDGSEHDIADSCAPIRDRDNEVIGAVLVFRDVSEEYAVQQTLRNHTVRIQTILNTVVDGIITFQGSDGNIESVNAAAERVFGYTAAELIKQNVGLLIPDDALVHYSTNNETHGKGHELIGRHKDGNLFAVEMTINEMLLGDQSYFTCILRDITARKQAEALQNAIFNSANFSSIATDEKGVIQIFNVGAERMLGYTALEVINKITPAEISDSQELTERAEALSQELSTPITQGFDALVFKASRGIEDIYELTYIRKDSSRFPAVVSVTALRDVKGKIIGYLLVGTDNTIRKRLDTEREQLYNALQEKNLELETATLLAEKSNLAKSEFLSKMSHELRTPLNAILGFAQLLEVGSPTPTSAQIVRLHQIIKAGWYLLELINEILDLAVIESGKISLSNEAVSMTEVMRECQSMIESQAEKRGITMIFMPFDNSLCAYGDRTRIKQIIINLLSNAIKYNCEHGTVEASCTSTSDHITIHIKDSGQGLTVEQLAQLFQPFNRLGQEAGNEEGTGIGLVVTKQLVELMGGSIRVNSTVGIGSEFHIELLRDVTPQLEISTITLTKLLPPASENLPVRTLLYVEDNPANLLLVEQIIEAHPQLSMLSAGDGYQGLSLARSHLPDVILMDINLPGICGIQTLNILRNDPTTMHIPVISLSANAMSHDIEKGLEAGFFRYLTKPIKITEFMNALDDALKFSKATVENTHETDTCHD